LQSQTVQTMVARLALGVLRYIHIVSNESALGNWCVRCMASG
jgi:hypothetical protein